MGTLSVERGLPEVGNRNFFPTHVVSQVGTVLMMCNELIKCQTGETLNINASPGYLVQSLTTDFFLVLILRSYEQDIGRPVHLKDFSILV